MNGIDTDIRALAALCNQAVATGWAVGVLPAVGARPDRFRRVVSAIAAGRGNARAPEFSTLQPRERHAARRPSPSSTHGMGSFPAHFDGVHQAVPPRLIVLYCARDEQARPTTLHSWHAVEDRVADPEKLAREVFIFRNGRRTFADTIVSKNRPFIRFDGACMLPATNGALALLQALKVALHRSPHVEHDWRPDSVLIIDNWSTPHGRSGARALGERVLFRATFD